MFDRLKLEQTYNVMDPHFDGTNRKTRGGIRYVFSRTEFHTGKPLSLKTFLNICNALSIDFSTLRIMRTSLIDSTALDKLSGLNSTITGGRSEIVFIGPLTDISDKEILDYMII